MKKFKSVRTAEMAFGREDNILATGGIGSCVVVCLWNASFKVGALAHMMLPHSSDYTRDSDGPSVTDRPGIAPDLAIPFLLKTLRQLSPEGDITAKLVGGGNMFSFTGDVGVLADTPKRIISNAKSILKESGVPVISECLGGETGRRLEFDVESGCVSIEDAIGRSMVI